MSEFETTRNTRTIILAVVVIAIVGGGAVVAVMMFGGGPTTTTTDEPTGNILTVLTRHDVSIHNIYEPAFLASDFAIAEGITDISWKTPAGEFWDDLIDLAEVDVCWGGGPTLFDQLMKDGRLEALDSANMVTILERVNDTIAGADMKRNHTDGLTYWVAAAISSFGFTVNHEFLDDYSLPTPTKWTDLANATYGSLLPTIPTLAMGNAPDTTSNTRIYEIIVQALGWEQGWVNMARMAGSANIYLGSVETQSAAEVGQVGVAMTIDFYGYQSQAVNPDCEYIVPEGQSIVNGDPIAIAETSSHKDWAEGFIDYILTREAQSLWLDPNIKRMPVMREGFDTPRGEANPDLYEAWNNTVTAVGIDFNDTQSLDTNTAFINYFEAVFTEAHTQLRDCWSLMVSAFYDGHITETQLNDFATLMGTPVTIIDPTSSTSRKFTLAYATEINNGMTYDSSYKASIQSLWTTAAKAQYLYVYNLVFAELP